MSPCAFFITNNNKENIQVPASYFLPELTATEKQIEETSGCCLANKQQQAATVSFEREWKRGVRQDRHISSSSLEEQKRVSKSNTCTSYQSLKLIYSIIMLLMLQYLDQVAQI